MQNARFVLILALALTAAACSGSPEIYEVPPGAAGAAGANADGDLILPDPIPAAPAFSIEVKGPLSEKRLDRLTDAAGVAVVAPVRSKLVKVKGPKGWRKLEVGTIESLRFRAVAPPAMREADFVWLSLVTGDVVPTFKAADRLGLSGGDVVKIPGPGTLAVGAWADNGRPGIVDILIDEQYADALEVGAPRKVMIGAKTGVTLENLAKDLRKIVPGGRLRRLTPTTSPSQPAPAPRVMTTSSSTSITGLHPTLSAAVQRLISASGGRVWLVSGFRSNAHQQILWQAALERYGNPETADNWVAPPGSSYHERGLAVDLGGDVEYAASLVRQLGLPLWRPMSWEPWHFELAGSRG